MYGYRIGPGELVSTSLHRLNILLHPDRDEQGMWHVLTKDNVVYIGQKVAVKELKPYEDYCQDCGAGLSSLTHPTCARCHTLKCACHDGHGSLCVGDGIYVEKRTIGVYFNDAGVPIRIKVR